MKNKLKKWTLMAGILCMMGLSVYGCGNAQNVQKEKQQENTGEASPDMDAKDDSSGLEPEGKTDEVRSEADDIGENSGSEDKDTDASGSGVQDQDTSDTKEADETDRKPSGDSTAASWDSSTPNLVGDIKEIDGMRLTVIEAYLEEEDDGAEIMVSPSADGDDSDFNKVPVIYDESTLFSLETIYGGGSSFDVVEAKASDLAKGKYVHVWGDVQSGELHASHIRIIETK